MTTNNAKYKVRAVHCDHKTSDDAVHEALERVTAPLHKAWKKLRTARRIVVKFNQDFQKDEVIYFEGQRQQLVSDSVVRAVLRLLRKNTDAELICADASVYAIAFGKNVQDTTLIAPILREFDVKYVDGTQPPFKTSETPGGGQMFRTYTMMKDVVEADAVVSVATMKNHAFMGVTGCLKNLFGLMPAEPHGRPRTYYHHLVRMPYMLADIGRIVNPVLNIVDALVGQAGMEWGDGKGHGRIVDSLVAGDQVIATDACMMHLMGHEPAGDWLTSPFHRDRNPILVAAENGFGTVDLDEIDFESEVDPQPEGTFFAVMTDSAETNLSWRKTMCEQALHYGEHQGQFEQYKNEYILLQDGDVKWHDPRGTFWISRRELAGDKPDHAMWYKFVDPYEKEGEHYEVYEQALSNI